MYYANGAKALPKGYQERLTHPHTGVWEQPWLALLGTGAWAQSWGWCSPLGSELGYGGSELGFLLPVAQLGLQRDGNEPLYPS